jgi:tetratricopeptide (TPR) repeat protein
VLLRARLASGQPEEALQLAETLVAEAPEDSDRRFVLAMTRAATGDLVTAQAELRSLVTEDPMREAAWRQLYHVTSAEGGPEAASAVLAEALEFIPASPVLLWARATELEQIGEIDAAVAIYEDLYARNSNSLVFANNLASLLVTYRDDAASLDRAWIIARRLRDTDVPAFQDTYGWLAFRRGEHETALPYLEAAAAGLPQDPIVQYHLAETYAALNRPEEAIGFYTRALDISGENDTRPQIVQAREALTRLQQAEPTSENQ